MIGKGELLNIEDIFNAYYGCIKNKKSSKDYLEYELKNSKEDLFNLFDEINSFKYKVGKSYCFVADKPKIREIFASNFRDRIVHHLLVGFLEPFYEKRFIKNVFNCRVGKGILLGINTLLKDLQSIKQDNYYYLQLDIKSFFMSIDRNILFDILNKNLTKKNFKNYYILRYLSKEIIFNDPSLGAEKRGNLDLFPLVPKDKTLFYTPKNKGLPIGNLTSQFFANVYLNELDKFIKIDLKTKFYYRYVDDFLLLGTYDELKYKLEKITNFLKEKLDLDIAKQKTKLFPINYDIDFIGYIVRDTKNLLPRKRNINSFKKVIFEEKIKTSTEFNKTISSINSYLGMFKHTKTFNLRKKYLSKLNSITFKNVSDFWKIIKKENIYKILNLTKKPMEKYKQIQNKYKGFIILTQIGCFYKTFDNNAIFLSKKIGLKLTLFNPNTKAERIMCGFHEKSLDKYKEIIQENKINCVFLKQKKNQNGEIERFIDEIIQFDDSILIPNYSQDDFLEIKKKYSNNLSKKIEKPSQLSLTKHQEFIEDFKNTDFSKKSFYEIIEYIINWKKELF